MSGNKQKESILDILNKGKEFLKNVDEIITEQIEGNKVVDYMKEKTRDIQVQVKEKIKNFTTEEIEAKLVDSSLVIELVLAGILKENISIEAEDNNLIITLDDKAVAKEIRKTWSVSKSNLVYDYSQYEESIKIDEISSKLENGILTITIPKKERATEKKKITIL